MNFKIIMMIKKIFLLILTIGMLLHSCNNDDDFGGKSKLEPIDFTVYLSYDPTYKSLATKGATVKLTDLQTNNSYTAISDENGAAFFKQIVPGNYVINASKTMGSNEYTTTFQYSLADKEEANFNGSQSNVIVNANTISTSIEMKFAQTEDLIFKQIYYAGSDIRQGAAFRDQFVEIYNNSDKIIFADGLYFAQLYGNNNSIVDDTYTLANGQIDWTKSSGMTIGDIANTNYIYSGNVYKIPGNGINYPIQPGNSIVLAANAINHKVSYLNNSGKPVNIVNPNLTVDLSNSDFEAFLGNYLGSTYIYDIQNPAVPDLEISYWVGNQDMVLSPQGRDGFVIFRATEEEFKSWKKYQTPKPITSGAIRSYLQIPNSFIIDGVDATQNFDSQLIPKKLPSTIDAGSAYLRSGAYSSKSIIRKIKGTVNGRIILKDTNNSNEDFIEMKAEPRAFATN